VLNEVQEQKQRISIKRRTNTCRTTQKVTHVLNEVQEQKQRISIKRRTNTYRTTQKVTHVLNKVQERSNFLFCYLSHKLSSIVKTRFQRFSGNRA